MNTLLSMNDCAHVSTKYMYDIENKILVTGALWSHLSDINLNHILNTPQVRIHQKYGLEEKTVSPGMKLCAFLYPCLYSDIEQGENVLSYKQ